VRIAGGEIALTATGRTIAPIVCDFPAAAHGVVAQRCLIKWSVVPGPQTQNAKSTTRLFPDESGLRFAQLPSHCPLPTAHPRQTPPVEVPAAAVYTSGHPLEKGPEILTFSHFSARRA
jgi:hypothetical protein